MKSRNEKTSAAVAKIAGKALQNPKAVTLKQVQKIAASVLTQTPNKPKK